MAKKSPEEKNKIIELYLESKKTITDFCSSKSEELPGAVTLLGWLEDSGYKMTKSGNSSELESKIKQLEDELLQITLKYEKAEVLEAMRSRRNSV